MPISWKHFPAGVCFCAAALVFFAATGDAQPPAEDYTQAAARIISYQTSPDSAARAWSLLAELTDRFPGRSAGTDILERAISWTSSRLRADGFANAHVEAVMVPHWVRGEESAAVISPNPRPLAISAFGGSVGTDGLRAETLVVRDFADLDAHAAAVKGKIVVYNLPFDEDADPQTAYRNGRDYRGKGASRAARYGAVGPVGHRTPHTGGMAYDAAAPKIPMASVSAEDAALLQRMQDRGETPVVELKLGAHTLPDAPSGNVVAEIRGTEHPEEVVLIGAHLDSWDITPGALDDGGGCVAMWEALRTLHALGLKPRRTIRLVLFTNEEFGTSGGRAYRDLHKDELLHHVLAVEADSGALPITGYNIAGNAAARAAITRILPLLAPVGGTALGDRFDGSDINPSVVASGFPGVSPAIDQRRYFHLHHTSADTPEKVDPRDIARLAAAMAVLAYVAADMPVPLGR